MPLEITNKTITKSDRGQFMKPLAKISIPYVPIYQWGYGRMEKTSPGKGLATACVISCIAVVIHCPTTGRTTLSHSPNYMNLRTTFVPMIDWVTGGSGDKVSFFEAMAWMAGRGAPGAREVQVAVMKGSGYATDEAARYGHEGYMSDLREFFNEFTGPREIKTDIVDAAALPSGTLTVDKSTGRITYLVMSPGLKVSGFAFLDIDNPSLPVQYGYPRQMQDLFVGNLSYGRKQPVDIGLQFDGTSYTQALVLKDEARCLIRSKAIGESKESQSAIIKRFGPTDDWLVGSDEMSKTTQMAFATAVSAGPPCERCGDKGEKKCGACKGAWYCSAAHQKADWPVHKAWCKAHAI